MKTGRQRKTRDRSAAKQPGGIPPDPVIEYYKRDIDGTLLIEVKRAAGRPRDLEAIAELESILARTLERSDAGS